MEDVGVCQHGSTGSTGTEGVEPGVEFHVTAMALLDEECHGVEHRVGGNALFARAETAPGFDFRLVPSVGFRSHLKDDGVDTARLQ